MAKAITLEVFVNRFPDMEPLVDKGTEEGMLAAQRDTRHFIEERWPVDTGLSRAGFHYEIEKRQGKRAGALHITNKIVYAPHVEQRVGVIDDAEKELNRRNWGINYAPLVRKWRGDYSMPVYKMRRYLKSNNLIIK